MAIDKNSLVKVKPYQYNPDRDIAPVSQVDVIDIADAYVHGMIPDNVVAPDVEFDGNDEPGKVWKRPSNNFEAIHLLESVKDYNAKSSATPKAEVE